MYDVYGMSGERLLFSGGVGDKAMKPRPDGTRVPAHSSRHVKDILYMAGHGHRAELLLSPYTKEKLWTDSAEGNPAFSSLETWDLRLETSMAMENEEEIMVFYYEYSGRFRHFRLKEELF